MFSLAIILFYFLLLLFISFLTSKGANNATFFNGNHSSPWYLVAFGTIGTTISGVTFVSVPGEVATNNWFYFQFVIGNFIGYFIIAFVLIPLFYRLKLISIYDFLRQRFGNISHRTGAIFFLISQLIGASFRLFLVLGVLQILVFNNLHIPLEITAFVALLMIFLYIQASGIKTIVFTDSLQTICIITALILAILVIKQIMNIDLIDTIVNHPTAKIFNTDPLAPSFVAKQIIAGIAIVIVMNGLDQNIMQKNLTCRSKSEAQKNICVFSFAFLIANLIFIALGTLLCIFASHVSLPIPQQTDDLFPIIVMNYLPQTVQIAFLLGIIAASFSSADSSLTALTTVVTLDILRLNPNYKSTTTKRKLITILMILLMFLTICLFNRINDRSIVSAIFTVAGYTYGPLLGLFAFGILTKRKTNEKFVPLICILSPLICLILSYLSPILLDGYHFGFELLLINGFFVYLGLYLTSNNKSIPQC